MLLLLSGVLDLPIRSFWENAFVRRLDQVTSCFSIPAQFLFQPIISISFLFKFQVRTSMFGYPLLPSVFNATVAVNNSIIIMLVPELVHSLYDWTFTLGLD